MRKHFAAIRTAKDCPTGPDQALMEAYLRTTYRVFFDPVAHLQGVPQDQVAPPEFADLHIGQFLPATLTAWLRAKGALTFVLITAWNPRSRLLPAEENQRRNAVLLNQLHTLTSTIWPALGIGDAGDWAPEESFFAVDVSAEKILELVLAWDQQAVVAGAIDGVVELWWVV